MQNMKTLSLLFAFFAATSRVAFANNNIKTQNFNAKLSTELRNTYDESSNHQFQKTSASNIKKPRRTQIGTVDFDETVAVKLNYVKSLMSTENEEEFKTAFTSFLEGDIRFSDVDLTIVRQMLERRREDESDLLLVLEVTGKYMSDDTYAKENIEILLSESDVFVGTLHDTAYDPYFIDISSVAIADTPALMSGTDEKTPVAYSNMESLASEDIEPEPLEAESDLAAIFAVCLGTAGLISLFIASVMLIRYNKSFSEEKTAPTSDSLTMSSSFDKDSNKDGIEHIKVEKVFKKHPWKKTQISNEEDEIVFAEPDEDLPVSSQSKQKSDVETKSEVVLSEDGKEFRGECFAPPGKLGVAVDTVNGVPVVHRVKPGSPLQGILFNMDRIVAIDEVDTSNMSAAEVTKLMVTRMTRARKISFVRGGDFAEDDGETIPDSATM